MVKGILCNWLVCLAVWQGNMARDLVRCGRGPLLLLSCAGLRPARGSARGCQGGDRVLLTRSLTPTPTPPHTLQTGKFVGIFLPNSAFVSM